jgi:hypothetical protein
MCSLKVKYYLKLEDKYVKFSIIKKIATASQF